MRQQDLSECIKASLQEAQTVLDQFVGDAENHKIIQKMAEGLAHCFQNGGKVLACGNGGSACDALHFAEEFTGRFRDDRKALPVIPLMEAGHITCVANDYGYDRVFARGVEAYGKPGDVLVALSTSGNSANVIRAVEVAKQSQLLVYLLIGKEGGKLLGQGDCELRVKSKSTERIQEVHMASLHVLIEMVERIMFPDNYTRK